MMIVTYDHHIFIAQITDDPFMSRQNFVFYRRTFFYVIFSPAANGGAGWIQALGLGMMR
jgi:hypothetical protein